MVCTISVASLIKSVLLSLVLVVISLAGFAQKSNSLKLKFLNQATDTTEVVAPTKPETIFEEKADTTLQLTDLLEVTKDSSSVDSLNVNSAKKGSELDAEIKYSAKDSIRFSVENKKVYLFGEAQITYKDIELKAAYIEIDQETKEVYAEGLIDSAGKKIGMPEFKSGDQQFKAKRMRYNFETEKGKILDVVTQEGEGNLRGEKVKKTEEGHYYIEDGGYTTCDADEPHFL
ncbi:MAG: lipopolysaccharide assembly outer membrane protein LptD (OstA), partial [Bacteroidia bacterium]